MTDPRCRACGSERPLGELLLVTGARETFHVCRPGCPPANPEVRVPCFRVSVGPVRDHAIALAAVERTYETLAQARK